MKKLINGLLLFVMLYGLQSCCNDYDPLADGNYRSHKLKEKNIMKTVRMSFGGDYVTESEEPLLRAEEDNTYTGINVWRTKKDETDAEEEHYAYGLFKGKDGISIELWTGYTYRFEATILVEDKDNVLLVDGVYVEPFRVNSAQNATFKGNGYDADIVKTRKFIYSSYDDQNKLIEDNKRLYFPSLSSGTAYVDAGDDINENVLAYPRVKRYYGTTSEQFDPGILDEVEIHMAYKSFGLRFEVVELPGGYLTVKDITKKNNLSKQAKDCLVFTKGLQLTIDEQKNFWDGLFSMNNLLAESESLRLQFAWHKGGGNVEYFESDVIVKPNTKKVLKLKVTGDPNYGAKGNINFDLESEALTSEEQTVRNEDIEDTEEDS